MPQSKINNKTRQLYYLLAFGIGFIALIQEIIWIRTLTFYSSGMAIIFGMVLGHYIYGLALGALFSREYSRPQHNLFLKAMKSTLFFLLSIAIAGVIFIAVTKQYDFFQFGKINSIPYIRASLYLIPFLTLPISIAVMALTFSILKKIEVRNIQYVIALLMLLSTIVMYFSVPSLAFIATTPSFFKLTPSIGSSEIIATICLYVFVTLTSCFTGAILPLITGFITKSSRDIGELTAYMFTSNIIGATLGSLFAGFILLHFYGLEQVILINAQLMLALIALFLILTNKTSKIKIVSSWATSSLLIIILYSPLYKNNSILEKLFYKAKYTDQKFLHTFQGRSGIINSIKGESGKIEIIGHGVYDGFVNIDLNNNINDLDRLIYSFFLKKDIKRILSIGLGSGSWSKILSSYQKLEKLTIIEINEDYKKLISNFKETKSLNNDPKVDIIIDDGRRWLNNNPQERFDLIIMNLTFYWRNHASSLLSQDFLSIVKNHLTTDGVVGYNPTNSMANVITGMGPFNKLYIYNSFLYLTDSNYRPTKEEKKKKIHSFKVEGKKLISSKFEIYQKLMDSTLENVKPKVEQLALPLGPITDNNMYNEFHISADLFTIQHYFPSTINYDY